MGVTMEEVGHDHDFYLYIYTPVIDLHVWESRVRDSKHPETGISMATTLLGNDTERACCCGHLRQSACSFMMVFTLIPFCRNPGISY